MIRVYLFRAAEITIDIEEIARSSPPIVLVVISTPIGEIRVVGSVEIVGRVLHIDGAHIGGLMPGALGRAGLNAIGRKVLEVANVDQIVVQGSARTTGAN